MRTEH